MKRLLFCLILGLFLAGCHSLHVPPDAKTEVPSFEPTKPIRVALVLGGGGAKGLAHLGAIRELEACGIRPDLIVGCSAGAIIGALYADDPHLGSMEEKLFSLKREDLLDVSFFRSRFGLVEGKRLQKFMERNLQAKTFSELQIPLIVVATDLFTGELIELSQKEIPIAVRASCSLPGIFKPVLLHGRYLIDGGASSPVPVEVAKKYGAEIVIAIDVSEKLPSPKPNHFFGVAKRGLEIAYDKLVQTALKEADIVVRMDFQDMGMFSDDQSEVIYLRGREKMRMQIAQIQELVNKKSLDLIGVN